MMREQLEALEAKHLAPLAAKSVSSKGRRYNEQLDPTRTCFQRDRDRIIHSKAFRRLKHKTQVFIALESDHYRSRLTHSLEVSQISRQLARMLSFNEDLCEAIALAHDLGHTPFGHAGENVLDDLMANYGGFEHNLQSLRVVDVLERKYPQFLGLNVSFELREGLIKHQTPWDSPQGNGHYKTIEAEIVNIADQISYNNHDIDDGISSTLLDEVELSKQVPLWDEAKKVIRAQYVSLSDADLKYLINSYMISSQIQDVVKTTQSNIDICDCRTLDDFQSFPDGIVCFSQDMSEKACVLRNYLMDNLYSHPVIREKHEWGQDIIETLFNSYMSKNALLPEYYQRLIDDGVDEARVVCDYIAGMTDLYAENAVLNLEN